MVVNRMNIDLKIFIWFTAIFWAATVALILTVGK